MAARIRTYLKIPVRIRREGFLEASALTVAFLVPTLLRWIPEALFPYPIGFDTPIYIAMGKFYAGNQLFFPLLYRMLGWMYSLGLDMLVVMKYLPTVLYGFLGVAVYCFCRSYLEWNREKSLIVVLFLTFASVSLRISWDLHKEMLATVFMFLALSQLKKAESYMGAAALIIFSILTAASHELIVILLLFILAFELGVEGFKAVLKKEFHVRSCLAVALAMVSAFIVFAGLWYGWGLQQIGSEALVEYYAPYKGSFSQWWWWAFDKHVSFFLFCYSFILPLAVLGYFNEKVLSPWLILGLIGSFSIVIFPWKALNLPFRLVFLPMYPFSFYLANALDHLGLQRLDKRKLVTLVTIFIIVNIPTWSLLGFMLPLSYFSTSTYGSFPRSMALSSIPPEDIRGTMECVKWFNSNSNLSVMITHSNYLGWVLYYTDKPVLDWNDWGIGKTLDEAITIAKSKGYQEIYLLWYWDPDAYNRGFKKLFQSGPMKIYEYGGS